MEIVPTSALHAITTAEIDVQISTAHKFPRSMAIFKKRAIEMACMDEQTAESCLYSRPVGKDENGKQKFAEGLSVRMAEIVAACFGNIRVAAMIVEQTPRQVKARGMAHDLENNSAVATEVIEATVKRPKHGQKEGDPYDERMRVVIAKAALAKARRDAIFQVVPKALARPIEMAVKALLAGDAKSIERRRKTAMAWIKDTLKIDPARVFAAFEIKGEADLDTELLDRLTGLRTAIIDKDTTADEAFPEIIAKGGVGSKTAPADGTKEPTTTPTEAAATAQAEPKTEAKTEATKTPEPKGPTAAELKKSIIAKLSPQNIGKTVLVAHLVEAKRLPDGAKFEDLDRDALALIADSIDDDIAAITKK